MTGLGETIISWVDRRIDELLAAPRMWGSNEAVEMQVLQLLELRAVALRPEQETDDPRRVFDAYLSFLKERFPTSPPAPLFQLADDAGLVRALSDYRQRLARHTLAENPFEHSHFAIRLTFAAGCQPSTSGFTGYYEDFRRAARAAVRATGKTAGRAKRDIEQATDFSLEDAIVSAPNGAPGQVLLRLGAPLGQQSFVAEDRVREALSTIMTLVEWAASNAPIEELRLDDMEQRSRAAVQARRLVPRRGIQQVALGGRLVSRSKPVEIHAAHERRFLEVVGAEVNTASFDQTDEIRAIDLDRGMLILGKARVPCFALPGLLGDVAEVGVQARVVGLLYRPLWGRPFVLADIVDAEAGENES